MWAQRNSRVEDKNLNNVDVIAVYRLLQKKFANFGFQNCPYQCITEEYDQNKDRDATAGIYDDVLGML